MTTTLRDLLTLAMLGAILCATGCACDRAAYVRQTCGDGGTNISVVIIMPEGGATLSALTGLDTNAWKAIAEGAAKGAK